MEKDQTRLLKISEVVETTTFSRAKLYALAAANEIPNVRYGRSVRIPAAALQRWINRNTTGGGESESR